MFWLFYILFEIFVWCPRLRSFLMGDVPMLHMAASGINDTIWLLPALALPVYCVWLIHHLVRRLIVRDILLFFFLLFWIVSLVNLDFFFRVQFLFILLYFVLSTIKIVHTRTISIKNSFFAMALLGVIFHYNSQLVPFPWRTGAADISVISFNFNTKSVFDDERTIQFIRQRVPDVVFLQELTHNEQRFITARLSDLYPHFLAPARQYGKNDVMILSRKPMLYGDHVRLQTPYDKSYHSANHAVIELDGQHVHLLNCHLHHAYKQLGAFLAQPDSAPLYQAMVNAYKHQQEEARVLAEYAGKLDGPVILAGDFNDTPNSMLYRTFVKSYQNAFASVGWGVGATFGEWVLQKKLPRWLRVFSFDMLRIDHVFFSKEFSIKSARVEKISAFDHHPQLVTAHLKKE